MNKIFNTNIAHRGLHDNFIKENSIKSFENAIKNNYPIELDVHLLKDSNVVVFHDDNLKRMTGIDADIKNLTYKDLKKINLTNTKDKIPLFENVLKLVNGKVPLLIELKYDQKVGLLEDKVIEILKDYKGLYYFQSFRLRSILYIKRKLNAKIGLLIHNNKNKFYYLITNYYLLKILKIDFISYPIKRLPNKNILKLSKRFPILIWTIRNEKNKKIASKYSNIFIFENNKGC